MASIGCFRAKCQSGKKKTNKHKHFRRDGVRDKWDPSPGQNGTRPRDKMGPVPGTNRPFSVQFHSKIAILSRLSLGRVGVRPWDDCPARAVRKMFMCFMFIVFFSQMSFVVTSAGCFVSFFNSVHTRCIVKTSGFTRDVCKNQGFS